MTNETYLLMKKKKPKEEEKKPLSNGYKRIVEETVERIAKIGQEIESRIFEMGRTTFNQWKKIDHDKHSEGEFFEDISYNLRHKMKIRLASNTLWNYKIKYERAFENWKLSPTVGEKVGWAFLNNLAEHPIEKKEALEVIKEAVQFGKQNPEQSIFKILEQHFKAPDEPLKSDVEINFNNYVDGRSQMMKALNYLLAHKEEFLKIMGEKAIMDLVRGWTIDLKNTLREIKEMLEELHLKPDESIRMIDELIKKKGGSNER